MILAHRVVLVPVFQRETRVAAPLDRVWAFHSRAEGLLSITPDWLHLRLVAVTGPDGEDVTELVEGTTIELELRPLGIAPRRRTASRIEYRRRDPAAAVFRDRMVEGPFDHWLHTHAFYADDGGTIVRDRVEYRLPGGRLGAAIAPGARVGMAPMFRYRHRETKRLLEGGWTPDDASRE